MLLLQDTLCLSKKIMAVCGIRLELWKEISTTEGTSISDQVGEKKETWETKTSNDEAM